MQFMSLHVIFFEIKGAEAYGNAYYGAGNGSIFLSYVDCTGNENNLLHCSSSKIGSNNCGHHEDAGVHCAGMLALPRCLSIRRFLLNRVNVMFRVFTSFECMLLVCDMQDHALMGTSALLVPATALKAGWRSALVESGGRFVTTPGMH